MKARALGAYQWVWNIWRVGFAGIGGLGHFL